MVSQLGSTSGGDSLGKMAKNCMKITKSAFLGQNSGGGGAAWGGTSQFFEWWGGIPPQSLPTRGNPGRQNVNIIMAFSKCLHITDLTG